jgi:hypothetical protein
MLYSLDSFLSSQTLSIGGTVFDLIISIISYLITLISDEIFPFILENEILLAGSILLLIALVVELLNGLLDFVVYTASGIDPEAVHSFA